MSKQAFDRKLAQLEALRREPASPVTLAELHKALRDRNNYFVSKAAALAGDLRLHELEPDLMAAFDRFLANAVKSDPQCWAKNAIAKALKNLEHRDPSVFLRGIAHFQLEPVWGGSSDTAATLRGTCALALINSHLDDQQLLTHLIDLLADPEKPARIDAVRAIAQLGRPECPLLLRLKALAGDREPEVVGWCFESLLSLRAPDAAVFVERFLDAHDPEIFLEAAAALGAARQPEALEVMKNCWRRRLESDKKRAILTSLGASPLPAAAEFLLSVVADAVPASEAITDGTIAAGSIQDGLIEELAMADNEAADTGMARSSDESAATAIAALGASRFRSEVRDRVAALAAQGDAELRRAFNEAFGARPEQNPRA